VVAERIGTIIISAFVAHTAWHWMTERWETLRQFPFTWPEMTPATIALALRWAMAAVALAALLWAANLVWKRRSVSASETTQGG
jgi:hypothetical protein